MGRTVLGLGACLVLLAGVSLLGLAGPEDRGLCLAAARPAEGQSIDAETPSTQPVGAVPGSASQPAMPATARTQPTTRPADVPTGSGVFRRDREPLQTRSDRSRGLMGQMIALSIVIIVLGVLGLIVVRKLLPRWRAGSPGRKVRIIETTPLGPRQCVHLLQAGSRRLLVGATRDRLSMLADVTDGYDADDESFAAALADQQQSEESA